MGIPTISARAAVCVSKQCCYIVTESDLDKLIRTCLSIFLRLNLSQLSGSLPSKHCPVAIMENTQSERLTYDGGAGGAFVEGQTGGQDVVEPRKKASDLWRGRHVTNSADTTLRSRTFVKHTLTLFGKKNKKQQSTF